ncbi:MAG: hypothetical protein QOE64_1206, partial [Frankiales bacterium]|jgi:hypothetical protein|nr:hypothetical protein [Frankiales bacterium]
MSPDQDVGAALVLATVGSPAVLDGAGAVGDGVPAGALVVGCEGGAVDPVGALLVLVAAVDGAVEGAVLRARLVDRGVTGTGDTTTPAGLVVSVAVGRTLR